MQLLRRLPQLQNYSTESNINLTLDAFILKAAPLMFRCCCFFFRLLGFTLHGTLTPAPALCKCRLRSCRTGPQDPGRKKNPPLRTDRSGTLREREVICPGESACEHRKLRLYPAHSHHLIFIYHGHILLMERLC